MCVCARMHVYAKLCALSICLMPFVSADPLQRNLSLEELICVLHSTSALCAQKSVWVVEPQLCHNSSAEHQSERSEKRHSGDTLGTLLG